MIVLSMILAAGLMREVSVPEVPRWGRFETSVANSRSYANPFTDVTLVATFIRPDKSRVSFWGFHDGNGQGGQTGHVWKLRFMPDQVGTWSYECSFSDGASGTSSDAVTNAGRAAADYANKPVFAFETSWEATPGKLTPDQVRTGAWGSIMGGAFYLYAECFEPTLTWGDGSAFAFVEIMNDFLSGLAYWKLKPDQTLVNAGSLCLADPGREYVVYRQSGGTIMIDLPGGAPAFQAEWLDPRIGTKKGVVAVEGGAKRTFSCPDARDWVLHLKCGE